MIVDEDGSRIRSVVVEKDLALKLSLRSFGC